MNSNRVVFAVVSFGLLIATVTVGTQHGADRAGLAATLIPRTFLRSVTASSTWAGDPALVRMIAIRAPMGTGVSIPRTGRQTTPPSFADGS